jgi:hypothetical protein
MTDELPDTTTMSFPPTGRFAPEDRLRREPSILDGAAYALHHPLTPSSSGLTRGPISHPAQAALGPRIKSEDDGGWGWCADEADRSSMLDSRLRGNDTVEGEYSND